jgi:peptidoglycan/xylan/chitin deacetylase (PgdA/CDA1 family)
VEKIPCSPMRDSIIKIPVFIYHSVAPEKDPNWYKSSYLTYEFKYFVDLIRYLVKEKYEFLFLDEYLKAKSDDESQKKKLICLTFDDGYLDNYVYVFPVLKKYKVKATIFVSPDFVEQRETIHTTLEEVWSGSASEHELNSSGFLSWAEMILMEKSGLVDIQSHTLTHTKYFSSDKIREFHHPRSNYLYPVSNLFPDRKPYYITDPDFINLLPFGTPFFEEKSALISRKVSLNPDFDKECVALLQKTDWTQYDKETCLSRIQNVYLSYKNSNKLITQIETKEEYESRVKNELFKSKEILEANLKKTIYHCCWPHGDYNDFSHNTAREIGYKSSAVILRDGAVNTFPDRFDRTGSGVFMNNRFLTLLKAKYKINGYRSVPPYGWMMKFYNTFSDGF